VAVKTGATVLVGVLAGTVGVNVCVDAKVVAVFVSVGVPV
jgi:hypothetical protein